MALSEYGDCDVEENGLFKAYPDLEEYWKEGADKFPYVTKKDEKYIGFVLISTIEFENNMSRFYFFYEFQNSNNYILAS